MYLWNVLAKTKLHLREAMFIAIIFQKKTKLGEGERVEGMKFLGIYPISGFERPFALFNGIHSNGASWTLTLMTLNKLVIFTVIPTDMCRANIPHTSLVAY